MIRAIRAVSSERGRDPREYAMVPFGGNGPLFAAGMAVVSDDIKRVLAYSTISQLYYIVLGEGNLKDGWVVRIYYNPLVMWIWVGAFIIFLGGLLTTYLNLKKLKNI